MRKLGIAILLMGAPMGAWGQWLNHPSPGSPRTKDGKANLAAAAPRGRDGKPDISGIWQPEATPIQELIRTIPEVGDGPPPALGSEIPTKYFFTVLADFKPGEAPFQPAAARAAAQLTPSTVLKDDPGIHCLPTGMPMADTVPAPFKIVQTPGLIMILVEADTTFRQVFTDGRKLPEDPTPAWLGNSIGKWEGDTLVVETAGLNDRTWLDATGHKHSEALHVTERFHRVSFGRMELQLTLDDPKTFTKPVTVKFYLRLLPDTDLIESFCSEDEKDLSHVVVR